MDSIPMTSAPREEESALSLLAEWSALAPVLLQPLTTSVPALFLDTALLAHLQETAAATDITAASSATA